MHTVQKDRFAVQLFFMWLAISSFGFVPIGGERQLTGYHNGNHMRNKISVEKKFNGVALRYIPAVTIIFSLKCL